MVGIPLDYSDDGGFISRSKAAQGIFAFYAMNEEEIKINVVLPYLQRLGLQASDLSFERTFSLQIGTNKILVDGRKPKRGVVGGRLDTLVKRHDRNLFILELKEAGHALVADDRDQAISYARLVHPIAPYAILTNGTDWQIFDTITKELLKLEEIKIKDVYRLTLPDADRDEALSFFLGYSVDNLLQFCRAQVDEQLKPLIGSPQDLTKKYIPQLTTPRAALLGQLALFENGPVNGFLLLAESGLGKTSALADYTLRRLAEGKPTVFFSGPTLENGLLPAITDEFGWVFSEELTPIMLIRRLSELAKEGPVIVVVDAIDEWSYSQRAQSLMNLLRSSRNYRIKFVFSCRTAIWESISQPLGSDIGFGSYLFCPATGVEPKNAYVLGPLSDPEFHRAVMSYRDVYKVYGVFEDKALNEARLNPFMLRVMFAVATELQQQHLTFSSREFFEKYLDLLLRKCGRRDIAKNQILVIAKFMFDRNEDVVSEANARIALSLSASEALLPALFEQNILQHRGSGYAFYFQHLRSYLIAFKVCGWTTASSKEFTAVKRSGVQRDALAFYLRYATLDQIQGVTNPIWQHAEDYLKLYVQLVKRYAVGLDHCLVPGKGPELGFIAEYVVHRHALGGYGFRRRNANEPAVLLVPVDEFFSKSNLLGLAGAESLHHFGSSNGFIALDIRKEVIENEFIERVKQAIKERRLNLRGCEKLSAEVLISAIYQDRETFSSFFDSYDHTLKFPISVVTVQEAINRAKLRAHFEYELIKTKRRSGAIKEQWAPGGFMSYSPDISDMERRSIDAAIDQAVVSGVYPSYSVRTEVFDLEEDLSGVGVFDDLSEVNRSPWDTEYGLNLAIRRDTEAGTCLLQQHLRTLFEEYLRAYQIVVDTNFSALKGAFPLRAQIPLRLFIELKLGLPESGNDITGNLTIAYERLAADAENEVIMCSPGELETGPGGAALFRGHPVADNYQILFRLERHLYSMGKLLLGDMVYARIAQEWPIVANHVRQAEGISVLIVKQGIIGTGVL